MTNKLGFMQGRLSNLIDNKIQCFPWNNWENEFKIAYQNDFDLMEWTLDQDKLYENPLMTSEGQKKIIQLCAKYNLRIESITGDCFMQMPFWKNPQIKNFLEKCFIDIIQSCFNVGIKIIVVPLVDNGSINNKNQEKQLFNFFKKIFSLIQEKNIKIAFETDYDPRATEIFINSFDNNYFGINYDIGNSAGLGFLFEDEMARYGDKIINVHIKDRILNGSTVPLGLGNANFVKVFKYLRKYKYKGNYILQAARCPENNHINILNEYRLKVYNWMKE